VFGIKKDWLYPVIINHTTIAGLLFSYSLGCAALAQTTTAGYGSSSVKTQAQKESSANLPSNYKGRSSRVVAPRSHGSPAFPNHRSTRVNHPWGLTPSSKAERTTNQKRLPETEKLINNDSLLPGQNRTQAMVLESETGHINPQEDSILAPKKNINNQHKANK
jgi:hypothetical protein